MERFADDLLLYGLVRQLDEVGTYGGVWIDRSASGDPPADPAREHQPTRRTTETASRDARTTGLLASKSIMMHSMISYRISKCRSQAPTVPSLFRLIPSPGPPWLGRRVDTWVLAGRVRAVKVGSAAMQGGNVVEFRHS
jgi:hypothetical protein